MEKQKMCISGRRAFKVDTAVSQVCTSNKKECLISRHYVNEPWLIDKSLLELPDWAATDEDDDNVRVYVPLDLSKDAILRRLERVIDPYGEANEENETEFSIDVDAIISQIEIYDQIWYVRHMPGEGKHSREAVALVEEFVARLKEIPDGCAERFPFETIDELEAEYLEREN